MNRTPRIDEIAEHGVLFESCFATNSLCSPSRATVLTGTCSHVNGVKTLSMAIDSSQPTFVNQLRAAGYRTAIVGKWHLGDGPGHDPEGFDYWDVRASTTTPGSSPLPGCAPRPATPPTSSRTCRWHGSNSSRATTRGAC